MKILREGRQIKKVLNIFILTWGKKKKKKKYMFQGNLPTLKIKGSFENIHYAEVSN